jgi:2-polyprenyl-6-methoxyphenol hydroxylase-like FAD-dependent oxidoreductase
MWDAVVVGARCAGASAALLLAQRRRRILLIDKTMFPSDVMSTLYIHQPGVSLLDRWGVLKSVVESGCPRVETLTYRVDDVELRGPVPALGPIEATYAPRRSILDQILIDAAVRAGAEFVDGCALTELIMENGRVTGARLQMRNGTVLTEEARLIVGADGMRSTVARLTGAPFIVEDSLMTCVYYSGWTGLSCGFSIIQRTGNSIGTVPTHDGVTLILTYFPRSEFAKVKTNPLAAHRCCIREMAPDVYDEICAGEQVIRLHGMGCQPNFFRKAVGPGWILIGDAGHHLDSITANGITNAFTQANLLGEALDCDIADQAGVDSALARFDVERYDALIDGYHSTLASAKLQVQDSRLTMLRAISQVPELTQRYFALLAGIISTDEFLTPDFADSLYQ